MTTTIYHNPRCSKSRAALDLLRERGIEPKVVLYLQQTPDAAEIDALLGLLGMAPRELMRTKEGAYAANALDDPSLDRQALVAALVAHPELMERPIVVRGQRAVLARPAERLLELL